MVGEKQYKSRDIVAQAQAWGPCTQNETPLCTIQNISLKSQKYLWERERTNLLNFTIFLKKNKKTFSFGCLGSSGFEQTLYFDQLSYALNMGA